MKALFWDGASASEAQSLWPKALSSDGFHDEKWLQALLFAHPDTIPIDAIDAGAGTIVAICRELPLPKDDATVFLDLLGVTPHGRLVLIECKLWRNPQARREVIAQVLEYAALLRRWNYSDLTARLKNKLGWSGPNPLYEHVRRSIPSLHEARFGDAVSRSLATGDFDLIVAGDGIRTDIQTIVNHLNSHTGLQRLALVEFQFWTDDRGRLVVIPSLPFRTEVIQHRVVVGMNGVPLQLHSPENISANEETEAVVDPARATEREQNRSFWQNFIDRIHFDHPDQTPPRHGGNNWVKIDMPAPAGWMTAFRCAKERAGFFVTLSGEQGDEAYRELEAEASVLEQEIGASLVFARKSEYPFKGEIGLYRSISAQNSDDELQSWLHDMANRLVNAIRPRLARLATKVIGSE